MSALVGSGGGNKIIKGAGKGVGQITAINTICHGDIISKQANLVTNSTWRTIATGSDGHR